MRPDDILAKLAALKGRLERLERRAAAPPPPARSLSEIANEVKARLAVFEAGK